MRWAFREGTNATARSVQVLDVARFGVSGFDPASFDPDSSVSPPAEPRAPVIGANDVCNSCSTLSSPQDPRSTPATPPRDGFRADCSLATLVSRELRPGRPRCLPHILGQKPLHDRGEVDWLGRREVDRLRPHRVGRHQSEPPVGADDSTVVTIEVQRHTVPGGKSASVA